MKLGIWVIHACFEIRISGDEANLVGLDTEIQIERMDDEQFLKIIRLTPLVAVDLIIKNQVGEVLLGKRINRPAQGYWFVPGGRIRKNETIESAISRISLCELGIELFKNEMHLLGGFDHIYDDNYLAEAGVNTHYVVLAFTTVLANGLEMKPDEQHVEIKWWEIDKILSSELVHENTRRYFLS